MISNVQMKSILQVAHQQELKQKGSRPNKPRSAFISDDQDFDERSSTVFTSAGQHPQREGTAAAKAENAAAIKQLRSFLDAFVRGLCPEACASDQFF
ncbi:MAG: hypothetical protein EZS28_019680 [Streblomastix strix]|uniref:Uncharacterized protein n=1 Tax=Streblomastix strix TaxID=222440 RepID=A0A5J4VQM0_9EUKA|nr:MAG: hypothetical protein EZS28_019680 [Streblomastix strix]